MPRRAPAARRRSRARSERVVGERDDGVDPRVDRRRSGRGRPRRPRPTRPRGRGSAPASSAGGRAPERRSPRAQPSASIARTLSSRRRWRSSPLNVAAEERDDALAGRLRADHPRAERQDVHVVVLDALVGRVRVVADGRPDAADLVRGDARPDAGAADQDAAVGLAVADGVAEPLRRSPGSRRADRSRRRRGRSARGRARRPRAGAAARP